MYLCEKRKAWKLREKQMSKKQKRLTDFERGWIIGMIDGEGYVGLTKHKAPNPSGFVYVPRIEISNCDQKILKRYLRISKAPRGIEEVFKTKNPNASRSFVIRFIGLSQIRLFLDNFPWEKSAKRKKFEVLEKYYGLRIKAKDQRKHKEKSGFHRKYTFREEALWLKLKKLNRRGKEREV